MKTKKIISLLLVLVVVFGCVGCKKSTGDTATGNGESVKNTEDGKKAEAVELELFSLKPETVEVMDEIIADFMVENTDIKLVQTSVADSTTVLFSRIATNEMPEIFNVFPAETRYKAIFDDDRVLDLTAQSFLGNIADSMLQMAAYNGKQYALPMTLSSYGIYYRTDLFEQYGVNEPSTYDELLVACKKLKDNGIDAFALPNNDVGSVGQRLERLIGVINNNSNEEFMKIASGEKKPQDSETLQVFAKTCLDIAQYSTEDSLGLDYDSAVADLVNGKAGMMISGTWMLATMLAANPDIQVKLIPFPSPISSEVKVPVNIDTSFAISAGLSAEKEAAALKFLEYMSRTEVAQKYYETDGNFSMVKGVAYDKEQHMDMKKLMDNGQTFLTQINFWPNGFREEVRAAGQQLFVDGDINAFIESFGQAIDVKYNQE